MKKKNVIEQYKGLSFADAAKKIEKKHPLKDTDLVQKTSFNLEMKALEDHQTQVREMEEMKEAVTQFMKGGELPKYENGIEDLFPLATGYQGIINNSPYGQISHTTFTGADPVNPNELQKLPTLPFKNPYEPVGPPKPFTGQVNTDNLSSGIGVNNRNIPVIDNNFGMSTPQDAPRTNEGSAYTPAIIGQGLSTAINAGILLGGAKKESPVDNPYEQDVKRLMQERGIDTTQQRNQILGAENAGRQNLNNVRSANIRNALDTNIMNVTQDSLAQNQLQEQSLNNQFKGEYAQVLNNLGQQKAQAQFAANQINAANSDRQKSNLSAFGAATAESSKFFTNAKLNEIQNKLLGDILNNKYSNVGLNKDVVQRLSNGKLTPDDITVIKAAYGNEAGEQLIKRFE